MYETITQWGIPDVEALDKNNIQFIFDSNKIPNINKDDLNLYCYSDSAKFCLYDYKKENIVFSMEFFEACHKGLPQLGDPLNCVRLELLNVHNPELRKKGIASYYLKKLQEYCINKKFLYIKLIPDPDFDMFNSQSKNNALSLPELKSFYKSISTNEMPIIFLNELYTINDI